MVNVKEIYFKTKYRPAGILLDIHAKKLQLISRYNKNY
jgi:hypothetical protein